MRAQTRDRLVGVMLLVLLAGILAPLVLRTPDEIRVALEMEIPEAPEVEPVTSQPPVSERELASARDEVDQARSDTLAAAGEHPDKGPLAIASGSSDTTIPVAWTVQVGSFASEKAARELASRLRDNHYSAYVREVLQDETRLFRVFVGPELDPGDARAMRERLASDPRFKLSGFVTPYQL